ncbi:ATP-binding protein [Aeromonas caviae]|uniref:ATP-binding protein n=1 Tax=Aeromonas caviae TaxID=648 RepID=UPI0039907930
MDDFLEQQRNLLLIGGTGTGQTHLAIALGCNAGYQGKRVHFSQWWVWSTNWSRRRRQAKPGSLTFGGSMSML